MKTVSSPPAAPRVWPVIDLVELTTNDCACSPNNRLMAVTSAASPSGGWKCRAR